VTVTEIALREIATQAESIARRAGAILRDRVGQTHDIRFKGTIDMVTEADQASEALIVAELRSTFPTHGLLSEEGSGYESSESSLRWVVDPLDGTTNFAHGLPTFAVSIGLEDASTPVLGVIYDPMRDELFSAYKAGGATLNGHPIQVSTIDRLITSLLATGFSYNLESRTRQIPAWSDLLTRVQGIRQTGSSALNLCYIASGRLDGYWERGIAPWDVTAGAVIVAEAGGTVSDYRGGLFRSDRREIVASNGLVHDQLLEVLRRYEDQ
jgi:myo-inositol-1(or 4)-monophosphatase